uniref:Translational activator of cytochrome c oxidase 1 n=1 Tax=Pogona vitticeps TaxID=103695 RepID=A0A6J0U5W1_9SAUR
MSVGSILQRVNGLFRPHMLTFLHYPSHTIHASCAALAGHNKWSKVKHVKGPKDVARSQIFHKLSMLIRIAVKEGGSTNPELNRSLANVIEQCRNVSMPKASIEAAINKGDKIKTSSLLYEVRGPGGYTMLIEVLTDNSKRMSSEIRHIMNVHGGLIAEGGRHNFERKGIVTVSDKDQSGSPITLDKALELAIEVGAEDVQEEEEEENEKMMLKFICAVPSLHQVREKLKSLGLCLLSSGLGYIPVTTVELSDEDMEQASQMLQALKDNEDVVQVYDNIA